MDQRICSVDDCVKPTRSGKAEWCRMHYHRWYRHGSVNKVATRISTRSNLSKYRILEDPAHPLAGKSGKVYVHRKVLYELIGAGEHACHWCGRLVTWDLEASVDDALQVDHLNSVRDDNRPENLAPSCNRCNVGRAGQARSDALREAGWWSSHDTVASLSSQRRVARVA